jgi:ankyrin repeat protein
VNQDDLNVDADPLIRAICKNDLKSVQALLKNHDDELNKFSNSIQILSQDERESLIIKRKSDFMGYSCSTDGFNAFILAYLLDRKDIFNFLINDNIIFSKDENNYFFFDYVILKEDVSMIRELIRMDICSFFDKKKVNPLNICVKIENKELFSLLLKCKNIDMEMINESNETILLSIINSHFMVEDKIELIKKLLNKGYDINYIPECYDTNEEEYTINNAIKKGEPRLIKFLLENDVCASSTYDRYAKSSLDLAIKVASVPIVDLLLRYNSYNSEIITEKFDYYLGSAILSKADISKVREIVKIMINHGGNVDVTTVSNMIYLDPDISVFELVINELNKKNLRGDGMDREIELTFIEIFLDRIIVEMDNNCYSNGMNYIKCIFKNLIHHEENYGKCYEYLEKVDTANKIELLRWLIENRLDFFTLDVISVIIREGHLTIIKDLIDHNVDLNRQDTNGYTPVYLAYLFKEERILNYLIKRYGVKIYSLNRQHEDFIACLHRKRCFQALEFYFDSDRTNKRHKIK